MTIVAKSKDTAGVEYIRNVENMQISFTRESCFQYNIEGDTVPKYIPIDEFFYITATNF